MLMTDEVDDLIPTRATLLGRLKNWKDQSSWQEFFDTYWRLIYGVARKAGLSGAEAQDVLQATMVSVADSMPQFKYNPKIDSFKDWLRNQTRLQIITLACKGRPSSRDTVHKMSAAEADPSGQSVDRMWEIEWEDNLLNAAVANVKRRLAPKKYQIYDLQVNKQWRPEKVASLLNMTVDDVQAAKRSITAMIEAEVKRLEQDML
jgi:RNA polymerase sigma factor (sigma-70 family)